MKKILGFIVAVIAALIIMLPASASAQQVTVTRAEFPVIINGNVVNNQMREYPFILYNSITYFPMTYEDCAFLGLENNWSAESGNVITKAYASGYYRDFLSPKLDEVNTGNVATVVTTPITVLGEVINNSAEQYPILNHNNILYFPLTWDWSQKFGWKTTFGENRVLEVATADFADAGFYFLYSGVKNSEPIKKEIAAAKESDFKDLFGNTYGYSPNYTGETFNENDLTYVFRVLEKGDERKKAMRVSEELLPTFTQNGWYTLEETDKAAAQFLKNHSLHDLEYATYSFPYIKITQYSSLADKIRSAGNGYTSLYTTDARKCAVRKEEADAYKSVGWLTAEGYFNYYINNCVTKGDLITALEFIEYNLSREHMSGQGNRFLALDELDYDTLMRKHKEIGKKYLAKMKQNMEFRASYRSENGLVVYAVLNCSLPAGKTIKSYNVSFDVVDASGRIINTVYWDWGSYISSYNNEKSYEIEVLSVQTNDYPNAYAIKNVRVSNIQFVDTDMIPGGQG